MADIKDTQRLAAHMLIQGHNCIQTASALGISTATIYKWNASPEFRILQDTLRKQLSERIIDKASDTLNRLAQRFDEEAECAFDTLVELHTGGKEGAPVVPSAVRLNAALGILDRAPSAPKNTKNTNVDVRTAVTIEAPLMENILKAAMESGHHELFRAAGVDIVDVEFNDGSMDVVRGDVCVSDDLGMEEALALPPQHTALTLDELLAQRMEHDTNNGH